MEQNLSNVWYATPDRIRSVWKVLVLSDKGSLEQSPGGVEFHGKKAKLSLRNVTHLRTVRQQLPWPMYAVGNLVLIVYLTYLSQNRWDTGSLLAALIPLNILILLIGLGTKWIEVTYLDTAGVTRLAYFADGSRWGWGGLLGGTTRLLRLFESIKGATDRG